MFPSVKDTAKTMRRQDTDWDKIFANSTLDKGLLSKISKELLNLNDKKMNYQIFFFNFFFFFFSFGCVGSLLLHAGFLQLQQVGATLRCSAWASHCGGFSCFRARALGTRASLVVARGLSSCGSKSLELKFSSCGAQDQLLHGMWDLPGPGIEPVSPSLAGGFLTTVPPGKSPEFLKMGKRH